MDGYMYGTGNVTPDSVAPSDPTIEAMLMMMLSAGKSENMKTNEVNKEISYETLLVTFGEGIGRLDTMFDDPQVWGVATLKQWIDGYETTRFTEIDDRTAVITSEYNMDSVKEWLQKNTPIINLEKR